MNIYELDKQATPGPFHFDSDGASHCKDPRGRTYYPEGPKLTIIDIPWPNGMSEEEWQANKLMFIHCRENFMKAIEALKEARSALQHHGLYGDATSVNAVIEELEEVIP